MSTKNCEHCKVGFLDFTGARLDATPPLYEHRCTACGKLAHERAMYEAPGQNAPAPPEPDPLYQSLTALRTEGDDLVITLRGAAGLPAGTTVTLNIVIGKGGELAPIDDTEPES